ncbi:hypothetical protein M0R45_003937 [Rubus argutus]|uniref:Uncharacterized protein n=1 Tax=Rubus argutus TaxID=59490 RepID=A0AAW1YIH0_RUBAR
MSQLPRSSDTRREAQCDDIGVVGAKRSARDSHVPGAVFIVHLATMLTGTGINPFAAAAIYNDDRFWDDQWIFWVGPFVGALVAAAYHQYVLSASATKALGSFHSNTTN